MDFKQTKKKRKKKNFLIFIIFLFFVRHSLFFGRNYQNKKKLLTITKLVFLVVVLFSFKDSKEGK